MMIPICIVGAGLVPALYQFQGCRALAACLPRPRSPHPYFCYTMELTSTRLCKYAYICDRWLPIRSIPLAISSSQMSPNQSSFIFYDLFTFLLLPVYIIEQTKNLWDNKGFFERYIVSYL